MTQAVFLRRIVDAEGLRELVGTDQGLVHLGRRGEWGKWEFTPVGEQRLDEVLAVMERSGSSMCEVFLRPRTKKSLREAVAASPQEVFVQETSVFGNEFEGWLDEAPESSYAVVGPEPERRRNWFAAIRWSGNGPGWIVE